LPVHLKWLDFPSEQDCVDLEKLYADAPVDWLQGSNKANAADWALAKVATGEQMALGYFNDRIVCGAWLMRKSESATGTYDYEIKQLCVRAITRDRGVAKQLLVRLCQWATESKLVLYIEDELGELSGLYELGFVQYLQGWRYTPL
jgi:GNAT superfamily N-acetyltransferase